MEQELLIIPEHLSSLPVSSSGQKFEETKVVIRSRNSQNRQYNGQKFEETKVVIRSRNSKNRQYNGQKFSTVKATYKFVFDSNTKGTINGAGTTYHSGTSELTPGI
jgi:hypothetical protein